MCKCIYIYVDIEDIQSNITEGNLEVKLPTIWRDEKAEVGRVRREEQKRKDQRK